MTMPLDRFDYSAMPGRKPLRLPNGARMAIVTVVNIEDWQITRPMPRTVLPPPAGAMGVPDVPNWAWHEYGMRVGLYRFTECLAQRNIKATTAINASVCLTYPSIAQAIKDAEWEFMGHGFQQQAVTMIKDEQAMVRQTVNTIREFTGKPPRGWLGPGLTETWDTPDILVQNGIEYVCDWVADDQPFEMKTKAGPLVSVPYSLELNDIPMMLVQHHQASELFNRTRDQFDRLYQESKESSRVMTIAIHPYVTGVPHRIKYLEQAYDYMASKDGVLFWTAEQVLDWWLSTQEA